MNPFPYHRAAVLAAATFSVLTTSLAGNWPQWRGPNRDDLSTETGLLKEWPKEGPKQLWVYRNAGKGYSGPSIVGGRLYTLGTRDEGEVLIALDAEKGTEVWTAPVGKVLPNDWGDGPRGTPTLTGGHVYALGGQGDLVCVEAATGKAVWRQSMEALGGKLPGWGYTESVLVDGDRVICTPGGSRGTIAALDAKTGKEVWRSTEFTDEAQYASIVPAEINGARQYIQLTMKSVAGVAAKDGRLLWRSEFPGRTAVIPTPIVRDGHVYVTAGYGIGCKLLKVSPDNVVSDVYDNKVMKNHHGGVILVGEHLYGHSDGSGWICQDFKTGSEVWVSKDLGKGAVGYADGMLYCLDEGSGTVALVEASSKGWNEKGRFKLDPQTTIRSSRGRIWTHPVIANGRLYLRDQDLIHCYDVKTR